MNMRWLPKFSPLECVKSFYLRVRDEQPSRDEKIAIFMSIVTVGFLAMVAYYYYQAEFLVKPFPFNTPFLNSVNVGCDFFGTVAPWLVQKFNAVGYGASYFPGLYIIAQIFGRIARNAPLVYNGMKFSFVIYDLLFAIFLFSFNYYYLKANRTVESFNRAFTCSFLTYPFLFTCFTGNFEGVLFMLLCAFCILYQRKEYATSTIPLAFAISMKMFPAVFLVLFIADKKYREILYVFGGVVVFSLAPLMIYKGGIFYGVGAYLDRLTTSQKMYVDLMVLSGSGESYSHSLLNAAHVVLRDAFPYSTDYMKPYAAGAIAFFALISSYIVLVEKELWKKINLLIICMCILPFTSTDYKLLHFFIPLTMFINTRQKGKFDYVYIYIFSILMIAKTYYNIRGDGSKHEQIVLNPLLMLIMVGLTVGLGLQATSWRQIKTNFKSHFTFKKA